MAKNKSSKAILVLESPWQLDDGDANRSSVIPFIEGIAKLAGDTDVYYANFYDLASFRKAFECLCKLKHKNTIVYVAAHGHRKSIGSANLGKCLNEISAASHEYNITGVMLGSCYVGSVADDIIENIQGSNLKWCVGYSAAAYWLQSTLIDCSIISNMIELKNKDFSKRETIIKTLSQSMAPFDSSHLIGIGEDNNSEVALIDAMEFYIQPDGQGHRAKSVTDEVFDN